tara:strand:+ start:1256 stop:1846 length:591 start_codon:yes stop_codon:yes gene_type:complete
MDNNQLDPPTQYDSEKYWDQRYDNIKKYSDTYDWYLKPSKLVKLFNNIEKNKKILVVGCGNSLFSKELYNNGFNNNNIYNIDISEVVIKQQIEKYKDYKMKWFKGDIINLYNLKKNIFDIIIDKGTIDALACGDYKNVTKSLYELLNVLKPRGIFLLISFSKERTNFLDVNLINPIKIENIRTIENPLYLYIIQKK